MQAQNEDEAELTGHFYKVLDRYLPDLSMGDKAEISLSLFSVMKQWAVQEELTLAQVVPIKPEPGTARVRTEDDEDGNVTVELDVMRVLLPGDEGYDYRHPTETIID